MRQRNPGRRNDTSKISSVEKDHGTLEEMKEKCAYWNISQS